MKQILGRMLALSLASASSFASSPALAGPYVGDVPDGSYRTQWFSKVLTDSGGTCLPGFAISSIAFAHAFGENLTYQESFQLRCTPHSAITERCSESKFVSNATTSTSIPGQTFFGAATEVMTGIRFFHPFGQNETYQQSYAAVFCEVSDLLAFPTSGDPARYQAGDKYELATEFSCNGDAGTFGGPYTGLLHEIGFSHPFGRNGTHEESVNVRCVRP